jgi:hypothetical protein
MSEKTSATTLRLPRQAAPVLRDGTRPAGPIGTAGLEPAAVDCNKLRGIARDMCYRAQARRRI